MILLLMKSSAKPSEESDMAIFFDDFYVAQEFESINFSAAELWNNPIKCIMNELGSIQIWNDSPIFCHVLSLTFY